MENKEVATVGEITKHLILGYLIYGIVFGIGYSLVYSLISKILPQDALFFRVILGIFLNGIVAFYLWRYTINKTFNCRNINYNDVESVMKNMRIFVIIICIISALANFSEINETFESEVNSSLSLSEIYINYIYNDEQKAQYQKQKEEAIEEAKSKAYRYAIILEVGILVVDLWVVKKQEEEILQYAVV